MKPEQYDDPIDQLLHNARDATPVTTMLAARVLADAARVQADAAAHAQAPTRAPRRFGWWSEMRVALGGWPGLSGVTLAAFAGLALGIVAPDLVDGLSGGQIGIWTGDLGSLPEIGLLWEEASDV